MNVNLNIESSAVYNALRSKFTSIIASMYERATLDTTADNVKELLVQNANSLSGYAQFLEELCDELAANAQDEYLRGYAAGERNAEKKATNGANNFDKESMRSKSIFELRAQMPHLF